MGDIEDWSPHPTVVQLIIKSVLDKILFKSSQKNT